MITHSNRGRTPYCAMAYATSKEIFSDVTLSVDLAPFKEKDQVKKILSGYCDSFAKTSPLCYEVKGSFEEIDFLFGKLSSLGRYDSVTGPSPTRNTPTPRNLTDLHSSSPRYDKHPRESPLHYQSPRDSLHHYQSAQFPTSPVKPVEVAGDIWEFIHQNCSKDLDKIRGKDIYIYTDDKPSHESPDKLLVTFESHSNDQVLAQFARERFVTFYQRLATDLQKVYYSLDPQDIKRLQVMFPELMFSCVPGKHNVTVTGRFRSIMGLQDFLKKAGTSSSKSVVTSQQSVTTGEYSRASGSSKSHSKPLDQEETCPICLDTIEEKKTLKCEHSFCRGCVNQAFKTKPVCPTCGAVYGQLTGTQPKGGAMNISKENSPLPGFENYGTIVIHYDIPSGTQNEDHPSPGQPYHGASRIAYLPDSAEGNKVLALLKQAFKQRLTFTIGRSSTTGMNNMVTWNDIHHKTSRYGGTSCYGYPDDEYLTRVQDELKVKGFWEGHLVERSTDNAQVPFHCGHRRKKKSTMHYLLLFTLYNG
ncbi:hypothetical protein UPYG_G00191510 [Umbra pygmaea]|uniref:E3 ubiquitin-protein ligase n=1 Tax=Umbra pygmaea TaxID=75934 RepID=A0ABD0WXJ7_UMBPY